MSAGKLQQDDGNDQQANCEKTGNYFRVDLSEELFSSRLAFCGFKVVGRPNDRWIPLVDLAVVGWDGLTYSDLRFLSSQSDQSLFSPMHSPCHSVFREKNSCYHTESGPMLVAVH